MSRYQTNNKDALAKVSPLFASSWLALFYFLRENYNERYTVAELVESEVAINDETIVSKNSD